MTGGEAADYFVVTDCGKAHGCDAATLRAVGIAAELAGGDDGLEVGGDGVGGAGEDAICRGLGRVQELEECGFVHVQDRIQGPETEEFRDDRRADGRGENLGSLGAYLGGEDAHPDLLDLGSCAPELEKLLKIAGSVGDLSGDGAVDRYLRFRDVLQDAVVGRRCAAKVVLGLEAVDGDYDVEELEVCPVSGNGAEGAGDNLDVNAAAVELGQDGFEFPIANEGIAAA